MASCRHSTTPGVAAVAEKTIFIGSRISGRKVNRSNTEAKQLGFDISRQIEHGMVPAQSRPEEFFVLLVFSQKRPWKFGTDFIGVLPDTWPNCGVHGSPVRAQLYHSLNCVFDNASQGATPSGMRAADHTRFCIAKEQRYAIGRQNPNRDIF